MADWLDVTGPTYWENDETVSWAGYDSNPVTWNGSAWVWESNFVRKEFKWIGPADVISTKLRFTYTMLAPDERRIEVYESLSQTYLKTFNYTTTVPYSGTELVLDSPAFVTGLQIRLRYGAGLLTKIEIFTDWSSGCSPFWTNHLGQYEVCV